MTKGEPRQWGNMRGEAEEKSLLLINDDINTFDHVIRSLVEVCGHDEIQAEQCALLTHHKGGCVVKLGDAAVLENMCRKLKQLNLDTVII